MKKIYENDFIVFGKGIKLRVSKYKEKEKGYKVKLHKFKDYKRKRFNLDLFGLNEIDKTFKEIDKTFNFKI